MVWNRNALILVVQNISNQKVPPVFPTRVADFCNATSSIDHTEGFKKPTLNSDDTLHFGSCKLPLEVESFFMIDFYSLGCFGQSCVRVTIVCLFSFPIRHLFFD
jgi:hypothetical protein